MGAMMVPAGQVKQRRKTLRMKGGLILSMARQKLGIGIFRHFVQRLNRFA
jgi:hypothetical protein